MFQNLFDSHTHSDNSLDAQHSVTFMVEMAVEHGIQGLAVTDHCDTDLIGRYSYDARHRQAAMDVAMAKAAFRNRIILTHGVELGQPQQDYEAAEGLLAGQHFDFVLLSLHTMRGWKDLYEVDYTELGPDGIHNMMLLYFAEMLEMVKWGNFDSLAHMSLPLRYLKNRHNMDIDLRRYTGEIDEVLRALVQGGKALEINTSGLRANLRDTLPPFWVVERFRELGGELVTLGSDAHRAGDIGMGIQDAMHLLLELGYDHFAFYRNRQPVMLRII